ncbi:MAG: DUF3343 domain-containing protein [Polyangiaceae bacterium]|nr:DUF3343 domain-containing protein [Polyangiaceae bacterium]
MSSCESQSGFGVVLFHSVQGALGAERLLAAAGVTYKLIAVPRHISSNCGFCIRFEWASKEAVERLLSGTTLGVEGIVAL